MTDAKKQKAIILFK